MSIIRADSIKNRGGNGAPDFPKGLTVTGVVTATTLNQVTSGILTASTLDVSGNATISGNLGVAGTITYEDVARVDATGISTFREGFKLGPLAGVALTAYKDGSIRTSGIVTAASFVGSGANLTGITQTAINNNADNRVITGSGTANTLEAESTCTYASGTLGITGSASGHGINLTNPGNYYNEIQMNANRSSANDALGEIHGKWNGTSVAKILLQAGKDTTNKDDGRIQFQTRESGQSLQTAMIIDESGYVTMPKQPSMQVQAGLGHNTATLTPIIWDQVKHNVGSCYNTSTGRFTAPIAGHYGFFFSCLSKNGGSGAMVAWARKNGGNMVYIAHRHNNSWGQEGAAIIFYLAANDYMDIKKEDDILFGTYTQWSMCLLS